MVIASESPFLQEATVRVFPALANAGQRSTICGPESFTPDKQPLFGETAVEGLFVNCAMNSRGIQGLLYAKTVAGVKMPINV